jgi:hypothetical protein
MPFVRIDLRFALSGFHWVPRAHRRSRQRGVSRGDRGDHAAELVRAQIELGERSRHPLCVAIRSPVRIVLIGDFSNQPQFNESRTAA